MWGCSASLTDSSAALRPTILGRLPDHTATALFTVSPRLIFTNVHMRPICDTCPATGDLPLLPEVLCHASYVRVQTSEAFTASYWRPRSRAYRMHAQSYLPCDSSCLTLHTTSLFTKMFNNVFPRQRRLHKFNSPKEITPLGANVNVLLRMSGLPYRPLCLGQPSYG